MNSKQRLVVYVDVDDTLVRSAGTKRMPIPSVVAHVKHLAKEGAELYCWSTAGSEYARRTASDLGIEGLFVAFLPKPNVLIDDQDVGVWKRFTVVHPLGTAGKTIEQYWKVVDGG
jgi:predicted HAD superfamily phosphohydrolase YqeG